MPNNVYSEIHLHITWHTKHGAVIQPDFEAQLHKFIQAYAERTGGVRGHAVNGVADHVHLAVSVPPTLNISEWLGKLKGASAYHVNHRLINRHTFGWQSGYGVVSFGAKDLPWVVDYIRFQKEHHASGQIHDRLERTESPINRAQETKGRIAFVNQP